MPPRLTMRNMLLDLREMKRDLIATKDKDGNEIDPHDPSLDDFQRKTLALTKLLEEIRPEIEREGKLRAVTDTTDRDMRVNLLRLSADNSENLRKAGALWKEAQQMVVLAQQRKKLDAETLTNRKDALRLMSEEIKELSAKNSSVHSAKSAEEKAIEKKRAARSAAKADAKRDRRRRGGGGASAAGVGGDDDFGATDGGSGSGGGSAGGGGGGGGGGGDGIEMSGPMSGEDAQFQAEVHQNRQVQDKMLEEILQGVNELGDLAGALSTEIAVQGAAIDELDGKIGHTTQTLKTQTAKLQELLDESGGPCRWVPLLICVIILLALIGFLYKMASS